MRVLLVAPYPPERDGIGTYSAMLARELGDQAHAVAVVSARDGQPRRSEVIASLARAAESALRAALAFAPDVVHVQFAVAAYGTRLHALLRLIDGLRQTGLPIVITMHEVTRDTGSLRGPGRALYRGVARRADQIVLHTESARTVLESLVRVGARLETEVIPHPRAELPECSVEAGQLRARHGLGDDRVLLAFGFIDVDKGLADLIAAAGMLNTAGKLDHATFVVAGGVRRRFTVFRVFELRDRIHLWWVRRQVASLGLQRHVRFTGFVPGEEIRAWFEAASAAVLPYRRSEQSGVASLAIAAGAALLTTDVGELGELSCVPAVRPGNPKALANQLGTFLNAGAGRTPSSPGGNLSEIVSVTVSLYRRLVPTDERAAVSP